MNNKLMKRTLTSGSSQEVLRNNNCVKRKPSNTYEEEAIIPIHEEEAINRMTKHRMMRISKTTIKHIHVEEQAANYMIIA